MPFSGPFRGTEIGNFSDFLTGATVGGTVTERSPACAITGAGLLTTTLSNDERLDPGA
jgi:hypothetical protein